LGGNYIAGDRMGAGSLVRGVLGLSETLRVKYSVLIFHHHRWASLPQKVKGVCYVIGTCSFLLFLGKRKVRDQVVLKGLPEAQKGRQVSELTA
jgi:hypothetical protein